MDRRSSPIDSTVAMREVCILTILVMGLGVVGCEGCGLDRLDDGEADAETGRSDARDSRSPTDGADSVGGPGDAVDGRDSAVDGEEDTGPGPPTTPDKLDMLWVIDNSLSMCAEHRAVRDNFDSFFQPLALASVDVHMAVTTTHFESDGSFEKVAEPGEIQSTPYPLVRSGDACQFRGPDRKGERDYTPLAQQIGAAVACTKNPGDFPKLQQLGNSTITSRERDVFRCALFDDPEPSDEDDRHQYCENVGKSDAFDRQQLFPCGRKNDGACSEAKLQQVYRDIPKVLETSDYRTPTGVIDVEAMERDFRCMTLVGTRGTPEEQGLNALRKAVSPAMTGGPVGDPSDPDAPNHGLIRKDAAFMATFVTDENDCSHSGSAFEEAKQKNSCGDLNCYFPTKTSPQDPLTSTSDLYSAFVSNLEKSKDVTGLESSDLLLASLHGTYRRYAGNVPKMCDAQTKQALTQNTVVCEPRRGSVRSGDRYADFIGMARHHFPPKETSGLMCENSLRNPMERLGAFVR